MQLVGGAVGATLGFFVGGPLGANAGWLIGGWLGGMLSGGGTQKGPKPQDMPNFNQGLRGTPIFMTFGANRVSAQIVWTKNYKAVRHNSGGKGGKGGGSGGMGSMKGGGSGSYYYTYQWDLVYHYGMVDAPSLIRNAWVGGDRVTAANLSLWQANSSLFSSLAQMQSDSISPSPEKATVKAADYFYSGGLPTGHPDLEGWPHFTSQEGVEVAWPYTCWQGFKKLDMGQSPAVPQISVELVPVETGAEIEPEFINQDIVGVDLTTQNAFHCGTAYMIANSKHWTFNKDIDATYAFGMIAVEDGTKVRLTKTQLDLDSPIGSSYAGTEFFGIPGTAYVYVYLNSITGQVKNYIMVYRLNDDQTLTMVSASSLGMRWAFQSNTTMTTCGVGVVDGNVYVAGIAGIAGSTSVKSVVWELGALGTAPDGDGTAGYWEANILNDCTSALGNYFYATVQGYQQPCATIVTDGAGGYRVLTYVTKYMIDNSPSGFGAQTTIDTLGLTYPNGFTVDHTGAVVFGSFDDVGLHADGTAGETDFVDYTSPSYQVVNDTAYLIWGKNYNDTVSIGTAGNACQVRLYTWDGSSQTLAANETATLFDDSGDLGIDNSDDTDPAHSYPRGTQFYMDDDGVIHWCSMYQGIQSITARYLHGTLGSLSTGAVDVTPPYIIYRILTSRVFGIAVAAMFGFSVHSGRIDTASYDAAVAYCEAQGIKIATTYTSQDDVLNVFEALLSLYGGYLVEVGGIIYFGKAEESDDTGIVVDNRNLVSPGAGKPPVATTNPAIQDGYNQIQYNYIDRALDYKNNQIEISDEVDIDLNGPRPKEFAPRFVMPGSLALMEAERALWSNLYGRATRTFKLGWNRAYLTPGDVFTLVDSFDPLLQLGVKVRMVRKKESKRGVFDITVVDHIPYQITANHEFTNVTDYEPSGDFINPPLPVNFRMYEVPKEFQPTPKTFVGYNQFSTVMGAQLHLSGDGTTFVQVSDIQPFCISGIIKGDLPKRPHGWLETNIEIYLMPTSPFDSNTPTYVQTHELDDIQQSIRAAGGGTIIVGSEAIAIEGVNLIDTNHYRISRMFRGWGGTPISTITSGTQWHYHGSGIFNHDIIEDDIGTTLWYKVVPYNFAGELYNIASIDARTYSIKGLYWLPRFQPAMKVFVTSPLVGTNSDALIGQYHGVDATGTNMQLTWPAAANNEGYGAGGMGAGGFGHFAADITSPTYRVNVLSKNGVAVSSFFVNTGYFEYTKAQNSLDFTGFASELILKVTPYTVKGDGPVSDVRSIFLFR